MSDERQRSDVERHERLERARTSAEARRELTALEPSRLFSLLALEEIPEERLGDLSARLEVELDRLEATPVQAPAATAQAPAPTPAPTPAPDAPPVPARAAGTPLRPKRLMRWGAAAFAAGLIGMAFLGWWQGRGTGSDDPQVSEVARATEPALVLPPMPAADTAAPRGVTLLDSPGDGQVVDLAVGDVRVVMIFDEALDL